MAAVCCSTFLSCCSFRGALILISRRKHLGLDVHRAIIGFVNYGGVPNGTLNYYSILNNPLHIAKDTIFITMTLMGDGFVVCPCLTLLAVHF